jgi:heme-degrading monooxygenase HmoA
MPVRMMLFSTIDADHETEFEAAFSVVRERVATVPGHVREELMRQHDQPGAYVLISDWDSREQFMAWLRSAQHDEMTAEMRPYFLRPSEMRFYQVRVS